MCTADPFCPYIRFRDHRIEIVFWVAGPRSPASLVDLCLKKLSLRWMAVPPRANDAFRTLPEELCDRVGPWMRRAAAVLGDLCQDRVWRAGWTHAYGYDGPRKRSVASIVVEMQACGPADGLERARPAERCACRPVPRPAPATAHSSSRRGAVHREPRRRRDKRDPRPDGDGAAPLRSTTSHEG